MSQEKTVYRSRFKGHHRQESLYSLYCFQKKPNLLLMKKSELIDLSLNMSANTQQTDAFINNGTMQEKYNENG